MELAMNFRAENSLIGLPKEVELCGTLNNHTEAISTLSAIRGELSASQ
jgi:hypothetical protein